MNSNTTATAGVTLRQCTLSVLNAVETAVIMVDADSRIIFINPLAEQLIGWSTNEAVHQPLKAMCRFLPDTPLIPYERETNMLLINGNGQTTSVERLAVPLFAEGADSNGYAILLYDQPSAEEGVMERKLLQIAQAKQDWEWTADVLPQLICLLDDHGHIIRANRTVEQWQLGSVKEVRGKTLLELLHPNIPPKESYLTDLLSGTWPKLKRGRAVETVVDDTHLKRHLNIIIQPIINRTPGGTFAVMVIRDITARKELEAELNQAQKMEAVGRLAGGVAHDFNNILMAIMGDCELISTQLAPDNPAQAQFTAIKRNIERGANLTKQLLAFGRKSNYQPKLVDLAELLHTLKSLIRRLIGSQIELRFSTANTPQLVEVDVNQFEQIILNLVVNARDAMADGGRLAIRVEPITLAKGAKGEPQKNYVRVTVQDDGVGIPLYDQPHIFEPFFTTKPPGRGTGLGLATAHSLMKQNQGYISYISKPGQGTSFYLDFPQAPAAEPYPTLPKPPASHPAMPPMVLVVEDEASVRDIIYKAMTRQGYHVLRASHAKEAMAIIATLPKAPDLLITDIVMPEGVNGQELAQNLKSAHPHLKVLFISGYTDNNQMVFAPWMDFLQKPFGLSLLAQRVQRLLLTEYS